MKSKLLVGILATSLMLTFAPSSFAQITVNVINSASAGESNDNRTAQTSDPGSVGAGILVQGVLTSAIAMTTSVLTLTFAAPITSGALAVDYTLIGPNNEPINAGTPNLPVPTATDRIRIVGGTGVFSTVSKFYTINYASGFIRIILPGRDSPAVTTGSFSIVGVRVNADGKTGPLTVTGSLGNATTYIPGTMTATIITATADDISGFAVGARSGQVSTGTGLVFTNRSVPDGAASFVIPEGFASSFRTGAQRQTDALTSIIVATKIRLTFAGVPSGVTLTLSTSNTTGLSNTLSGTTITSTNLTRDIDITADDLTATETIQVNVAITVSGTSTAALTAGDITVTAAEYAQGDAFASADTNGVLGGSTPTVDGGWPRFAVQNYGPITIASVLSANSTLLIPYAVWDSSIRYDTGIALANTTKDPFVTGSATPTDGTVKVTLFPKTADGAGTSVSFTTSSSKRAGTGLATDGKLVAGGSWVVLLSAILAQEGIASPFTGYIFLEAAFLNAHGITFVTDFHSGPFPFTSFSPMLVVPPPASTGRSSVTSESLSF